MHRLEDAWRSPLRALLLPFGLLFGLLGYVRRLFYRYGLLESTKLPVPVVIVGNITAGGSGKTPLVMALSKALSERGLHPGIVSRGYGGKASRPISVEESSRPEDVGDEPILLRKTGFPVWVGRKRGQAAQKLLDAHPECDILIGDDGLQHYALCRDFEIAVIDASRGLGNGLLLPAGPLREPPGRLKQVNAIVLNGGDFPTENLAPAFGMRLSGNRFINIDRPEISANAADFSGKSIHAIAGIGNPGRFFTHLYTLGLQFTPHPFPDHHPYKAEDLEFENCDIILMTEKDAIKCRGFAPGKCWFLQVEAQVDPGLAELILKTLGMTNGS